MSTTRAFPCAGSCAVSIEIVCLPCTRFRVVSIEETTEDTAQEGAAYLARPLVRLVAVLSAD